jgi:uncharacterized protein (DUF58 family)
VIVGALGLGLAAMATGNNLLYLILGAMLGLITLSGWLSEVTLRGITAARRVSRGIEAGSPTILVYEIRNEKRLLPSFALEVGERRDAARGFAAIVRPGASTAVRVKRVWDQRGVYPLDTITLSTSFPFGLFRKERDLEIDGKVVVWPRTGRAVREVRVGGDRAQRSGELTAGLSGARGEYRSLRGYLPGDDPRDVHWRSTARTGVPVVREYAREQVQALWLCLDLRGVAESGGSGSEAGSKQEIAVEIAAALAARAARSGHPCGLVTSDEQVEQAAGVRQLEVALDVLARARFRPDAPPPLPPLPPGGCVLVTPSTPVAGGWGDVFSAGGAE